MRFKEVQYWEKIRCITHWMEKIPPEMWSCLRLYRLYSPPSSIPSEIRLQSEGGLMVVIKIYNLIVPLIMIKIIIIIIIIIAKDNYTILSKYHLQSQASLFPTIPYNREITGYCYFHCSSYSAFYRLKKQVNKRGNVKAFLFYIRWR